MRLRYLKTMMYYQTRSFEEESGRRLGFGSERK